MRNITYFESITERLKDAKNKDSKFQFLNYGESYAYKAYKNAKELNLNMPIVLDGGCNTILDVAKTFSNAHIDKFIYSIPSTDSTDTIAVLLLNGYKIAEVVNIKILLREYAYKTCCEYGLVFAKK